MTPKYYITSCTLVAFRFTFKNSGTHYLPSMIVRVEHLRIAFAPKHRLYPKHMMFLSPKLD